MNDSTVSTQTALIYIMVLVSASDRNMADSELKKMGDMVSSLRIFEGYDPIHMVSDAETCAEILDADEGFQAVLGLIAEAIPDTHTDTAYAIACDIAIADNNLSQEELRVLELIRHHLNVERLIAAAIERAANARNRSLS